MIKTVLTTIKTEMIKRSSKIQLGKMLTMQPGEKGAEQKGSGSGFSCHDLSPLPVLLHIDKTD